MLIGEANQSHRKVEERIAVEGMALFKRQKEEARRRKVAEQQEVEPKSDQPKSDPLIV